MRPTLPGLRIDRNLQGNIIWIEIGVGIEIHNNDNTGMFECENSVDRL